MGAEERLESTDVARALGNFFAGIVLVVARPYAVGDRITVLSGSINGPHEGIVRELGLVYTTLQTGDGPLSIPNSVLLMSAVRHSVQ